MNNPACEKRNAFYQRCSAYKECGSAGLYLNNIGGPLGGSVVDKVNYIAGFKFNITFENSSYPGYATEKLLEALCSKTIPLYWGSPTAAIEFNPKAFLNRHDYANDQAFIEKIVRLHNDKDAYNEMYLQPMFRDDEYDRNFNENHFLNWFDGVVYK
mgnify:CR=1 FL=1